MLRLLQALRACSFRDSGADVSVRFLIMKSNVNKYRLFSPIGAIIFEKRSNYRLSPQVRHPSHVEDVVAALAWVQENIGDYGGDGEKLFLIGHSAGAHLAALAAVDHDRLLKVKFDPGAIQGVILLDGAGYDVPAQVERLQTKVYQKMFRDAFTDQKELQRDASPVFQIEKGRVYPNFFILYVESRKTASFQAERLLKSLQKVGGQASVHGLKGKTHSSISRDLGRKGDEVTQLVETFLMESGK